MEKLTERLTNLNIVSKSILKYGMLLVFICLIISLILIRNASNLVSLNLAREFVCSNVHAFCEVIIGAIMFDVLMEKKEK